MPRHIRLPRPLDSQPFAVRDAVARGVGEGRLRGRDLLAPFHGVRVPVDFGSTVNDHCRAYSPLLRPQQRFSHVTAALIWGCPLDNRLSIRPVHVSSRCRAPRSVGVAGHQSRLGSTFVRHGLPVGDPVTTWLELASMLPLDELVIAADHLVLDPRVLDPTDIRPYVTLDELRAGLSTFHGRGAAVAARALKLVRDGAESRPETQLRLLVTRSRLPEPEVNPEIVVRGVSLGYGDLYFREWHTIAEYDGDHHRTNRAQYDKDMLRIERLERAGEQVVRVRGNGLHRDPAGFLDRLAEALRIKGWPG